MKLIDYLKYAFDNGLPNDLTWITDMFTIVVDGHEDNYIRKEKGKLFLKVNDKEVEIPIESNKPFLTPKQKIKAPKGLITNLTEDIETTIGRLIMNYLLLAECFGNKIPYMNKEMKFSDIESIIEKNLVNDDDPEADKKITVSEYKKYMDTGLYIMNFNRVFSVSITEKSSLPPEGIEEYKKQLIEELKKKYGPHALEDKKVVAELEKKLLEYDREWLEGDPAYGKLISGKVVGARKKMFIMYGTAMEFTPSNKAKLLETSLYEGYPKDPEKLALLFNDSRLASYSRGAETQKGGVAAKVSLRATNDIKILDKDCGTKFYIPTLITEDNYKNYLYRYYFDNNGKTVEITEENVKNLIGKTIKLRTPMYCNLEHHYCVYCTSSKLKGKENAIALLVTETSGAILNESLKKMHKSGSVELTEFDIYDEIS